MRVLFVYHGDECLALEYLSAVLRRAGHETRLIFDPALFNDGGVLSEMHDDRFNAWIARQLEFRDRLIQEAEDYAPDLIAISVLTHISDWAKYMARELKRVTGAPVVVGGVHVSATADETMEYPHYDYGVVGEGDDALLGLVEAIQDQRDISSVPNLMHRSKTGEVIKNPLGSFPDLASLPWPDKDLFYDVSPHFRHGYIVQSARGCPMRCTFCSEVFLSGLSDKGKRDTKTYLRQRTADDVVGELEAAHKRYGFDHLRIYDDIFAWDRRWFEDFAPAYAERVGVPYWCFVYPSVVNERFVEMLVQSGCADVQMGVQSLSPALRKSVMNRNESSKQVAKAVELFHDTPITLTVDNIIGVPGQQPEELLDAARFYSQHRPDRVNAYWLTNLPGTDIISLAEEQLDRSLAESGDTKADFHAQDAAREAALKKVQSYLVWVPHLPVKANDFIIRNKLYRYWPAARYTYLAVRLLQPFVGKPQRVRHTEGRLLRKNWIYLRRLVRTRFLGLRAGSASAVPAPA